MSQDRTLEVSEAEIAVHWQEEAYVHPPEKFIAQANLTDKTVFERLVSTTSRTVSRSTPVFSTGIRPGTSRSIQAIRRSGDGSSAAD